jgi:hypothetical protein
MKIALISTVFNEGEDIFCVGRFFARAGVAGFFAEISFPTRQQMHLHFFERTLCIVDANHKK